MPDPQAHVGALAQLVRGEMTAVETYERALIKFESQPEAPTLRMILRDHHDARARLAARLSDVGAPVPEHIGAFGQVAKAVHAVSTWINDEIPLQVLIHGEKVGADDYRKALDDPELAEARLLLRANLDGCERHMVMLEELREHVNEPTRPML